MHKKIDYKKDYKEIYIPKQKPSLLTLDPMTYITLTYEGDPNKPEFQPIMAALYGFAYTIKMKSKQREDYYDYVVFPLEGEWDIINKEKGFDSKGNLKSKIMIRQPDFLDEDLFNTYKALLLKKERDPAVLSAIERVRLEVIEEGPCVQMLHIGSYDNEPATFQVMEAFCKEMGYKRKEKTHKEIYLSDPRKVAPEKLRTVLRFKVTKQVNRD